MATTGKNALLIGEMTVLDAEQQPVVDALQRGGLQITAIHKHQPTENPNLWWVHFAGYGDAIAEATALHSALRATATPLPPSSQGHQSLPGLDTAALDQIFGEQGKIDDGAYRVNIPVSTQLTDTRAQMRPPEQMEASTMIMFQPLPGNQVVTNGDFARTADQVNPVMTTLRQNGIQIVAVHNHMLYEQPRMFYMHYWATGDANTLPPSLRAALDRTH